MELKHFHGIAPRYPSQNLQGVSAEVAENVKLWHGTLAPWRAPKHIKDSTHTTKTIYQVGCCWFEWDACVEVAEWVVDCPRLYVTGDGDYPYVMALKDDCATGCAEMSKTRLGVPAPKNRPQMTRLHIPTPPNGKDSLPRSEMREQRAYVYTYVNCLGEESAPSFASNEQDIDDGEPVSITGFLTPPSEFGITHIRIYRRVTGHRSDTEAMGATPLMTDFYHVGTIEVGTATFIDKGLNIDTLGEALTTFDVLEPPAGLRGILAVPNTRILVGFDGNTLCFSMNNQPYNWPESRRYNLDDNIVAIRESGGMLYVMTDGHPYVVEIDAGDDIRTCQSILRLPTPMPMITCCSAKGALSTPMGVFYVSSKGLVRLAQGAITVVTMPWFASDDWRELKPETMRLGYAHGAIFIVSDTHAFVFFTDDATYGDSDAYRLTTIDLHPRDMVTGRNGELFMLLGNGIYQWDAGARFMPYRWKSAKIKSTRYGYFGAIRLWGSGSVDVSIFAEAQTVLSAIPLRPQTSYRLPRYGHHLHHQIELAGIHTIESVELANTRWDLSKV